MAENQYVVDLKRVHDLLHGIWLDVAELLNDEHDAKHRQMFAENAKTNTDKALAIVASWQMAVVEAEGGIPDGDRDWANTQWRDELALRREQQRNRWEDDREWRASRGH